MKWYDLTLVINEDLPIWPGNPGITIDRVKSLDKGDRSNLTQLMMGVHSGTHVDAPNHFEPNGKGVDELSLDDLIGPCRVIDMTDVKHSIDRSRLEKVDLHGRTRILLKTTNSEWWEKKDSQFHNDYVHLSEDAAQYLVDHGARLVGIDYLSIERYKSPDHATHHILLGKSVVIIEGLNLSGVPADRDYELISLPAKIKGADGAPTRVILREMSE